MSYKAVGNNVVVSPHTMEEKTESGIIIPDAIRKEHAPESGEVLSIGAAIKNSWKENPEFKEGDVILFSKTGNVSIDDEKGYLSVPYMNIHCKK